MADHPTRRTFLQTATTGGSCLALGDLAWLSGLPPVSAAETEVPADTVRLRREIEPLVRLLEETPRDRLLEEVGARIRRGLSYRDVLAALFLAAVRNVQPRPSVGFKFHAVLVVNSVHLASQAVGETDRWLPIFWALDYFKDSQARDVREGDWTMGPVDESAVPPSQKARKAFVRAMENWDEAAADAAVVGLARTARPQEIYELFYRYGSRDFRSIGHKAIFVANSQRTLQHIGWQYAEPILRSLAYALLMHEGDNPAQRDAAADRPRRRNQKLANQIKNDWQEGQPDKAATASLLAVLRQGSDGDACDEVVHLLNGSTGPRFIWDALFCGAGELLMRQPSIVALHAVTTTNAMHFAYQTSGDDLTRKLLLLQNTAFLPLFREAMKGRGRLQELAIDGLKPQDPNGRGRDAVEEIFVDVSRDRTTAARKVLAYLDAGGEVKPLLDVARRLMLLKSDDAHDYKFGSAVLEDHQHVSPSWRNRYIASGMMRLSGSGNRDNRLVERTRAALQG